MEGWLLKLGEKGLLNLKRKRWFVLDATLLRLRYFKDKNGPELGFINLADALKVDENWRLNPKDQGGFVVVTRDRRWQLEAESAEHRDAWVRSIVQCLPASQLKRRMDSENVKGNRLRTLSLPTGPQSDPTLGDSVGGVIFEFEEDFDTASASGTSHGEQIVSDTEDDDLMDDEVIQAPVSSTTSVSTAATATTTAAHRVPNGASKTDINSSARMLATSVPVSIPQRLAATWHDRGFANWSSDEEDEPEDHRAFEKPHEVVAKTYQEHYLKTGDLQFEVPVSESRKIKALI